MKNEMDISNKWNIIQKPEVVRRTVTALKANGIDAYFVNNGSDAKHKVIELLPKDAEVMNMTSMTLDTIGLSDELTNSAKYRSVKKKLESMDRNKQGLEMQRYGAAPEWAVGSIHAVTQDGKVIISSATGSQLPAYAYGATHVIWVVGTQKIVKDMEEGLKRIYNYSLPLESERARKAYGVAGSAVNKILIVNREFQPGRITIIFVNEALGF